MSSSKRSRRRAFLKVAALSAIAPAIRLGVANAHTADAPSFAQFVLRLNGTVPVYQQQMTHSMAEASGPGVASADWCAQQPMEFMNSHEGMNLSVNR